MRHKGLQLFIIELFLLHLACQKSVEPVATGSALPPVYITVAGHIEDVPAYAAKKSYVDFRQKLLEFADEFAATGAALNLQIDYEFLYGTLHHETDSLRALTKGKNVIDYLVHEYGFEIDAHQEGGREEGQDNYADVHYVGKLLCEAFSDVVGGLVWDDPPQFACLAEGEPGRLFPHYVWKPAILTLAVGRQHHLGDFSRDDIASGVWKPKGAFADFWVHDPQGCMAYVGPGEHADQWGDKKPDFLSTPEFVQAILNEQTAGAIDIDKMYTVTLAVPQKIIFDRSERGKLWDILDRLKPTIDSGQAKYVTYSEAVRIWKAEFQEAPNIYFRKGVTPPHALP
ncbi:MAG TPA: hypothetical protein ENN17_12115 [bacterium]|nr:hypothetical protein [bacterium]